MVQQNVYLGMKKYNTAIKNYIQSVQELFLIKSMHALP